MINIPIHNKYYFLGFTLLEIVYLIFMFIFFKTTLSITHPYELYITNNLPKLFLHPIDSGDYCNKISESPCFKENFGDNEKVFLMGLVSTEQSKISFPLVLLFIRTRKLQINDISAL